VKVGSEYPSRLLSDLRFSKFIMRRPKPPLKVTVTMATNIENSVVFEEYLPTLVPTECVAPGRWEIPVEKMVSEIPVGFSQHEKMLCLDKVLSLIPDFVPSWGNHTLVESPMLSFDGREASEQWALFKEYCEKKIRKAMPGDYGVTNDYFFPRVIVTGLEDEMRLFRYCVEDHGQLVVACISKVSTPYVNLGEGNALDLNSFATRKGWSNYRRMVDRLAKEDQYMPYSNSRYPLQISALVSFDFLDDGVVVCKRCDREFGFGCTCGKAMYTPFLRLKGARESYVTYAKSERKEVDPNFILKIHTAGEVTMNIVGVKKHELVGPLLPAYMWRCCKVLFEHAYGKIMNVHQYEAIVAMCASRGYHFSVFEEVICMLWYKITGKLLHQLYRSPSVSPTNDTSFPMLYLNGTPIADLAELQMDDTELQVLGLGKAFGLKKRAKEVVDSVASTSAAVNEGIATIADDVSTGIGSVTSLAQKVEKLVGDMKKGVIGAKGKVEAAGWEIGDWSILSAAVAGVLGVLWQFDWFKEHMSPFKALLLGLLSLAGLVTAKKLLNVNYLAYLVNFVKNFDCSESWSRIKSCFPGKSDKRETTMELQAGGHWMEVLNEFVIGMFNYKFFKHFSLRNVKDTIMTTNGVKMLFGCRSIGELIGNVRQYFLNIVSCLMPPRWRDALKKSDLPAELKEWAVGVSVMCTPEARQRIVYDEGLQRQMITLRDQKVHWIATINESFGNKVYSAFKEACKDLDKMLEKCAMYLNGVDGEEKEPFSIWMYGAAGGGKTTSLEHLMKVLLKNIDDEDSICFVNPNDDFMSTWSYQRGLIIEEFLSTSFESEKELAATYMRLVSGQVINANKAALEEKGMPVNPIIVGVTSNVKNADMINEISNESKIGFKRRRHIFLEVIAEPAFCEPGSNRLSRKKIDEHLSNGGEQFAWSKFQRCDAMHESTKIGEPMTFTALVTLCFEEFCSHLISEKKRIERNKIAMETVDYNLKMPPSLAALKKGEGELQSDVEQFEKTLTSEDVRYVLPYLRFNAKSNLYEFGRTPHYPFKTKSSKQFQEKYGHVVRRMNEEEDRLILYGTPPTYKLADYARAIRDGTFAPDITLMNSMKFLWKKFYIFLKWTAEAAVWMAAGTLISTLSVAALWGILKIFAKTKYGVPYRPLSELTLYPGYSTEFFVSSGDSHTPKHKNLVRESIEERVRGVLEPKLTFKDKIRSYLRLNKISKKEGDALLSEMNDDLQSPMSQDIAIKVLDDLVRKRRNRESLTGDEYQHIYNYANETAQCGQCKCTYIISEGHICSKPSKDVELEQFQPSRFTLKVLIDNAIKDPAELYTNPNFVASYVAQFPAEALNLNQLEWDYMRMNPNIVKTWANDPELLRHLKIGLFSVFLKAKMIGPPAHQKEAMAFNKIYGDELVNESSCDPNMTSIIESVMSKNVWVLKAGGQDARYKLRCLQTGSYLIVPYHFFRKMASGSTISLARPSPGSFIKVMLIYDESRLERVPDSDISFYRLMANEVHPAENIAHRFIGEMDLARLSTFQATMVVLPDEGERERELICDGAYTTIGDHHTAGDYKFKSAVSIIYNANTLKGQCGSPVFHNVKHIPSKILGFHILGMTNAGGGMATALTRELVTKYTRSGLETQCLTLAPTPWVRHTNVVPVLYPSGATTFCGMANPLFRTFIPHRTTIEKSVIHGRIFEPTTAPAILSGLDPRFEGDGSPLFSALGKYGKDKPYIDMKTLCIPTREMSDELISKIRPVTQLDPLTCLEACNGCMFTDLGRINLDASPGYWEKVAPKGQSGKRWLVTTTDDGSITDVNPLIHDAFFRVMLSLEKGEIIQTPSMIKLKDERRKFIKISKPRIYEVRSLEDQLVGRSLFGQFAASIAANPGITPVCIGTNVEGPHWTRLYNRLRTTSAEVFDGDFKEFDGSIPPELYIGCVDAINEWYDIYSVPEYSLTFNYAGGVLTKTYTKEQLAFMRFVYVMSMIYSPHLLCEAVFICMLGLPSGSFLTSILGSLINWMLFLWAFYALRPSSEAVRFCEAIALATYGDDVIDSVAHPVRWWFNFKTIAMYFASFGIIMTSAVKTDAGGFVDLTDTQFLKRKFVQYPGIPVMLAPIEKATIQELTNWIRKSPDPIHQTFVNCSMALRFAYHHGPKYFRSIRTKIVVAMRDFRLESSFPVYEELDKEFLSQFDVD